MDVQGTYTLKQKLILECALRKMFLTNYESVEIGNISDACGLQAASIRREFFDDDDLRMSAVEYAAHVWVNKLRDEVVKIQDRETRVEKIIRSFIAGSESYPESLSVYIDVWKQIRDNAGGSNTIRKRLVRVYNFYAEEFCNLVSAEQEGRLDTGRLEAFAMICVVISDGMHIQSFINSKADFDSVTKVMCRMLDFAL